MLIDNLENGLNKQIQSIYMVYGQCTDINNCDILYSTVIIFAQRC